MPTLETTLPQESTQPQAGRISKTAAYYLAFIALGMAGAALGATLPDLIKHTQSQLGEISYLFTARSLGYLVGSFVGGYLYDRRAGHPVMAAMLLGMAAALALVPSATVLWLLIGVILLLGIGEGALDVGGNTLLVWVHRHLVGPYMNGLHFFFGIGAFLAPIIIDRANPNGESISWAYWILALLVAPAAIWLLRLPSPVALKVSKDGPAGQVNHRLLALLVLFFFLYVGAEVSFGGWIFTYALEKNLAPESASRLLTSAFWGALTVGRLLAIPIAARVRPRFILLGDIIGSIVSVGLIMIWPDSLTAVWLGTLGIGLAMASIFPTTISLAERRMTVTGQVTGWFFVGASTGAACIPWLIGQFFEASGPQVFATILMVDLILNLVVLLAVLSYSNPASAAAEA